MPVPGTALAVELVEVAAAEDGSALWFGRTEVPWELLDVFVYGLDEEISTPEADAVTRPSKPYISMDRGFGRHGYPAISVNHLTATEFCRWLSAKTGRPFRLPTLKEWQAACALGAGAPEPVMELAWCLENSQRRTHPVGSRPADASGLHDLLGNAAEWVTDRESFRVVGGSYRDRAEALSCALIVEPSPDWNASDPQIPRGQWWLADGGFIGFRVVCDQDGPGRPAPSPGGAAAKEPPGHPAGSSEQRAEEASRESSP